ncbi:unnamed protein product, partial [marine sediment metagenome]
MHRVLKNKEPQLFKLNLLNEQLVFYFEETMLMLFNWLDDFIDRVKDYPDLEFSEIFRKLTPIREKHFLSKDFGVRGFIDAIEFAENKIKLIDYKTSRTPEITDEYRLQLAIYALLYKEVNG